MTGATCTTPETTGVHTCCWVDVCLPCLSPDPSARIPGSPPRETTGLYARGSHHHQIWSLKSLFLSAKQHLSERSFVVPGLPGPCRPVANFLCSYNCVFSQVQHCTPRIPASQETETGRLHIQGQPGQLTKTVSKKKPEDRAQCPLGTSPSTTK